MVVKMSSLVKETDPILKKQAEPVQLPLSDEDLETLRAMAMFLMESQSKEKDEDGIPYRKAVGIAAPQIGISKQMFVTAIVDDENDLFVEAYVNPHIDSVNSDMVKLTSGEGCLSVQSVENAQVARYSTLRHTSYKVDLSTGEVTKKIKGRLEGYDAIVFQHEYDHLAGMLFTDLVETNQEEGEQKPKPEKKKAEKQEEKPKVNPKRKKKEKSE
jgi:peptide deformylase